MKDKFLTRKEKIILSTIDLINEIGIKDLSIKEIAQKENVTEAALYKHFQSKEQILIEVLEYYSKYDLNITKTLEENVENKKQNIIKYFVLYSEYYENYPAITSILGCYEVFLHEKNIGKKIEEMFKQRTELVRHLIETCQINGNIRKDIKAENLTDILVGTFERIIFRWRLSGFTFSLKEKTIELMNNILYEY